MTRSCVEPLPLYRPRDPRASDLWRLMDRHFEAFQRAYGERFTAKYGFWRPIVERSVTAFLRCGDLHEGFARVRCPDCQHEVFVAYSCKQRCTCPSCRQNRTLLTARHVAQEVCLPVAHRQIVLTIPKRLRLHTPCEPATEIACLVYSDAQLGLAAELVLCFHLLPTLVLSDTQAKLKTIRHSEKGTHS